MEAEIIDARKKRQNHLRKIGEKGIRREDRKREYDDGKREGEGRKCS